MKLYLRNAKIGGASGAIDALDGFNLSDGDAALLIDQLPYQFYRLDATSGLTADGTTIIEPAVNAGLKRWIVSPNAYEYEFSQLAPKANPVFTETASLPAATTIGSVTAEEISYVSGVTASIQDQLDEKIAGLNAALTGTPTATTAAVSTNTTQIATTAFCQTLVAALVDSSPSTLNTLKELATALGDDPNFATTMAAAIATKFSKTTAGEFTVLTAKSLLVDADILVAENSENTFSKIKIALSAVWSYIIGKQLGNTTTNAAAYANTDTLVTRLQKIIAHVPTTIANTTELSEAYADADTLLVRIKKIMYKLAHLTDASLTLTDVTTNDVSITKHGFVPKAPNNVNKVLCGDGTWKYGNRYNQNTSDQTGFSSDTYLVGSNVDVAWLQIGTRYKLVFSVTKTGAGTATPTINIRFGTNGSTADTAILTFIFNAGTAAIDEGLFTVDLHFRSVGSGTTAVVCGVAQCLHELSATTGLVNKLTDTVIATSAGFDSTPAGSKIGASVNGGSSASWTVKLVQAELVNLQ